MLLLGAINVFVTYHNKVGYNQPHWAYIIADISLVTYIYYIVNAPQSDLVLLYFLPLITAAEYLGGIRTAIVFALVSAAFAVDLAVRGHTHPSDWFIFLTREGFLAFGTVLSLFFFQVTSEPFSSMLSALRRLDDAYQEALGLDTVLDEMLRRVEEIGFEFVGFSAVDPYRRIVEMTKARRIPSGWMRRSQRPLGSGDIIAYVADKKAVESPRWDDPRFERETWTIFKHYDLARVYVPVISSDKCVGVLQTGWERKSKGDVIPQELIDQIVAIAKEYSERVARTPAHVFLEEVCADAVQAIFEADCATVHIWRNEEILMEAGVGFIEHSFVHLLADGPESPVRMMVENKEQFIDDPETLRTKYPQLYHWGRRGVVSCPLNLGAGATGVLLVHFLKEYRIGATMREQIQILAGHVGTTIENRLLLAESALRASRAWMQSRLSTVEDALSSGEDLRVVLDRAAKHFLYNFEADCVVLYEYNSKTSSFVPPPVWAGILKHEAALKEHDGIDGLVTHLIAGSSEFISEVALRPEFMSSEAPPQTDEVYFRHA